LGSCFGFTLENFDATMQTNLLDEKSMWIHPWSKWVLWARNVGEFQAKNLAKFFSLASSFTLHLT